MTASVSVRGANTDCRDSRSNRRNGCDCVTVSLPPSLAHPWGIEANLEQLCPTEYTPDSEEQTDGCCNQAVTLRIPLPGILSVMGMLRQPSGIRATNCMWRNPSLLSFATSSVRHIQALKHQNWENNLGANRLASSVAHGISMSPQTA